ncbi:MAG: hypothetical protein R6U92_04885 [Bacillota bacterium]
MIDRLANIDRRVLYVIILVLVAWPLISPIGLPVSISQRVVDAYETVESLEEGDTIVWSFDYTVGGGPDCHPQTQAVWKHLARKNIRVVCVSFVPEGSQFSREMVTLWEQQGKVYGEDMIDVGFIAGFETGIGAFVSNPTGAAETDIRGNNVADLPIMEGIEDIGDFDLVGAIATGAPGPFEWVRQLSGYDVDYLIGVVTVMGPQSIPFWESGQAIGLLMGLRDAASYEILIEQPGLAVAAMDSQSFAHLYIILLVIVGNIVYFVRQRDETGA